MAGGFARVEARRRTRGFLLGLLADLPRKNCWSIAEHAGDRDPHGMQHLLARATWDTDGVRDDLRDYVTTQLGDAGKGLAGLDEHQVRRWISWQRWTLLAMLAHALLAVIAAHEHTQRPAPDGLIALTCNEIRRLFTSYVIEPGRTLACPEAWSRWRRRHQHRARTSCTPAG